MLQLAKKSKSYFNKGEGVGGKLETLKGFPLGSERAREKLNEFFH